MGITGPCKDCIKRKLHCHSSCEDYRKYKDAMKEVKRARQEQDITYPVRGARTRYSGPSKYSRFRRSS